MIINITGLDEARDSVSESFLENRYDVISRSGLSITEMQLIGALPQIPVPGKMLILGNRSGVLGMIASRFYPDVSVTVSSLDIFHHHAIERNLGRNPFTYVTARCEAFIPEREYFNLICIQVSRGSMPDELIMDLLQQSHGALTKNGLCVVSAEDDVAWLSEQMKKSFGHCSLRDKSASCTLLVSQKKKELKKIKNYRAEFTMTVPHGSSAQVMTLPGVFAHRRVDEGAQALAEVAETQPNDIILDMGCGCGSIGLSLAVNQPTAEVVFVDSNSRATYATEENCKANKLPHYRVILSDHGLPDKDRFTLFVGNPPYYSHDRISDLFIQIAHQALKTGGRAYIVAKHAEHNAQVMQKLFGNVEIIKRRNYEIAKAIKS